MMKDIILNSIQKEYRKCLCCGKEFYVDSFIEQDFCNRCYPVVCKNVFDKANGNLTIKELKEKIKKEIEINEK